MTEQPASHPDAEGLAALFSPFEGGGLSLKNRFVMAPMTRWMSPGQYPDADVAGYIGGAPKTGSA
jgi:2,4-dienoyl-CoA reductase-like NADH-dependent reductase (Old Yellow Enzyme family)